MNPLHDKVCRELITEANLLAPDRAILENKINEVSKARVEHYTRSERLMASRMAEKFEVDLEDPDFRVILSACHEFRLAFELTKKREHQLFHVNPAPPPPLFPVQGQPVTTRYTLLQNASRGASDLKAMAKAFGINNIRDLVLAVPERLVLHNIAAEVVTHYGLEAQGDVDEQLSQVVPDVCKEFMNQNPTFTDEVNQFRETLEQEALSYLEAKEMGASFTFDYSDEIENLIKQATLIQEKASEKLSPAEIKKAIAQRIADLVTKAFVKDAVKRFFIDETPRALEAYPKLSPQKKDTRKFFMINGGIASGKGTTKSVCVEQARKNNVEWSDVMVLNADSLKPLLLNKEELEEEDRLLFSSLTQDETYIIRDLILEEYQSQLDADKAPHFFWDQTKPVPLMFDMATTPEGQGLDLFIVQMPAEKSFQLAYARGEQTGRFETTSGILSTHAAVPTMLLTSLKQAQSKERLNVRLNILANVSPGVTKPVVEIDFEKKVGKIRDLDHLLEFFKKAHLNQKAETFETMYPSEVPREVLMSQIGELASYLPDGLPIVDEDDRVIGRVTSDGVLVIGRVTSDGVSIIKRI